jgi:hypothetical protein
LSERRRTSEGKERENPRLLRLDEKGPLSLRKREEKLSPDHYRIPSKATAPEREKKKSGKKELRERTSDM